jgi:hypothetical protein
MSCPVTFEVVVVVVVVVVVTAAAAVVAVVVLVLLELLVVAAVAVVVVFRPRYLCLDLCSSHACLLRLLAQPIALLPSVVVVPSAGA